jgi:hypothetical protein
MVTMVIQGPSFCRLQIGQSICSEHVNGGCIDILSKYLKSKFGLVILLTEKQVYIRSTSSLKIGVYANCYILGSCNP